jgi:hypothetical protein
LGLIAGISAADLELVRGWLSPAILFAIFVAVTRHYATVRTSNTADRKLDHEAEASLRDDYAEAVKGFREEVAALKEDHRKDMAEMRQRNEECDKDRDHLREKVSALRAYADGLYRVILQNSASKVLELGDFPSPEIKRAAERVDRLFKERP